MIVRLDKTSRNKCYPSAMRYGDLTAHHLGNKVAIGDASKRNPSSEFTVVAIGHQIKNGERHTAVTLQDESGHEESLWERSDSEFSST